jgi:PhoH-like ATPase
VKRINAKVVDTSTLVHDPDCITYLMVKGNMACIPWTVLEELDGLKSRPDIGLDAREAIRNIEKLRQDKKCKQLDIVREQSWQEIEFLDRTNNDHKIIATANHLKSTYYRVELVSKDSMMRIKARELNFVAEDYYRDQAKNPIDTRMPRMEVPASEIDMDQFTFPYSPEKFGEIQENNGIICISDWTGDFKRPHDRDEPGEKFTAVRKKDHFHIVKNTISAFGVRPYAGSEGGDFPFNWPQSVALYHLLSPDVSLVFLEGGAGTGKTLLALASALETRSSFRQILVSRPLVHLEDKDNMGFLPGDIREKMEPWLRPIWQNLSVLKEVSLENKQMIEKLIETKKIDIEPLDYIRGTTLWKCLIIIDEAQNLTPHQVKTIITRAGEGSKVIFTGDLDQIDRKRRLDKSSSGLAYAASRLTGQKIVATVKFQESVRSELAKLGVEML